MDSSLQAKATNYDGKVVSLKVITDQNQLLEAVGYYVSETDKVIRFRNLHAIVPQQDPKTGQVTVGFMVWTLSGDPNELDEVYKHTIASIKPSKPEVKIELDKIISPITVDHKKLIT